MTEKSYFNTNNECNPTLQDSKERALRQQNRILSYFQSFPNDTFTPEEVWKNVFNEKILLTSVRRAMTNLTDAGKIKKTDEMRDGSYGHKCHTWRSVPQPVFAKELF